MTSADVVIIGGGVAGASVAHHLATLGVRNVMILDRAAGPGQGSTGRATGGYRAQFATAINVRLSLLTRRKLLDFRDETGVDPGYAQVGYLWLADDARQLSLLKDGLAIQRTEGLVEAREVGRDEIAEINPAVALDGVHGGVFCSTDGYIRPLRILEGYLASAQRLGCQVRWDTTVRSLVRDAADRITAVVTDRETIPCQAVVNAAGAWAAQVAALAEVGLPVDPLRRQVAITEPTDLLPATMPMTIFAGDGYHLRVRDGRVLLLWPNPGRPGAPFDTSVDDEWIATIRRMTARRIPKIKDVPIVRADCWAGLYEMSPDRHAILGPAVECPNLFLINGSSGHGVMHSPALGQLLAEMIHHGRARTLDVSPLSPSRFREGRMNRVSELL